MLKNKKIRTKLDVAFIGILLFVVLLSIYQMKSMEDISNEYENVIDEYKDTQIEIAEMKAEYLKAQNGVMQLTDGKKKTQEEAAAIQKDLTETSENISSYVESLLSHVSDSSLKDDIEALEELMANEREEVQKIIGLVQSGQIQQAQEIYNSAFSVSINEGNEKINRLIEECGDLAEKNIGDAYQYRKKAFWVSVGFTVLLVMIIVTIAVVVVYSICRPLKNLVDAVRKISTGDLTVEIQKKEDDEIGELADALSMLLTKNRRAAQIARDISNGDLSMVVKPESDADVLGVAFKYLVDENNKTLTNIRTSASQVNTGSAQVASASQSLAQGSTQQASALEQVTASINDITVKTGYNAENASKANELIQGTSENAKEGQIQMSNMV